MWRLDPVTGESTTYLDQGGAFNGPISDQEQLFFQASSLEIVKRGAVLSHSSIAGKRVLGFFLPEAESHDVNVPHDWIVLEHLVSENPGLLPPIGKIT
jgi:CMP-N-acetylneuraminic acid synthetase